MKYTKEWLQRIVSDNAYTVAEQEEAEAYYRQENTKISNRLMQFVTEVNGETVSVTDPYKANWKLSSGFLRLLIEQKVNYSINSGMVAKINGREAESLLGKGWIKTTQQAGRDASMKKYGVLQFYLDSNGELKWKRIRPEQCVLCYDQDEKLVVVVRMYAKLAEGGKAINVAEVWDGETVAKWEQRDGEVWKCENGALPHLTRVQTIGGSVVEEKPLSWGRPPFAIFRNNEFLDSDLKGVKNFIDAYDFTNSDFCNNLEDFQDAMWIIKNYDGQNISEFFRDIKNYKAVKVDDEGEARQEFAEIPHEAKSVYLDRLKYDIFLFGMGVNTDDLEGNITNVRIKAMYNNLDLKAETFEQECNSFISQWAYFATGGKYADIEVEYDRSLIMNTLEMAQLANQSIGSLSEETRLANDPRVSNVVEEMQRLQKENIVRAENAPTVERDENVEE